MNQEWSSNWSKWEHELAVGHDISMAQWEQILEELNDAVANVIMDSEG